MGEEQVGEPDGPEVGWGVVWAVFLVAAGVLFFEVALTRLFSVLLRFHFVFLVLSCAIGGLGVGGMLSVSSSAWIRSRMGDGVALCIAAAAFGASLPLSVVVLLASPLARYLYDPLVIPSVAFVPFLFAGAFLSYVFHVHSDAAGRLYFADLAGAATGSLAVVLALNMLGGMGTPVLAGLFGVAACALLLVGYGRRSPGLVWLGVPGVLAVGVIVLLALTVRGHILGLPRMAEPSGEAATWVKLLQEELRDPNARIIATDWNAFARTDVVANKGSQALSVYTDGDVPSTMLPFTGDLAGLATPDGLLWFPGLAGFVAGPRREVLCLGSGAGLDVLLGLIAGAEHITGVELNPSMPWVMYRFRDLNGAVYARSNFDLHVGEARAFVRAASAKYDLIYMALTKTATSATSGLALVESYVATKEAFADYLDHLTEQGRLVFVCQEEVLARRVFLTGLSVLEDRGIKAMDGCRHLSVLAASEESDAGPYRFLVFVKKTPFSDADLDALMHLARTVHLQALFVYGREERFGYFTRFTQRGHTVEQYVADQPENVEPVTDDRPFLIDVARGITPPLLRILVVGLAGLVLSGLLWAWVAWRSREARSTGRLFGYFVMLGVGFMLIEVALIQKLILILAYPTLTFSVILFSLLLAGGLGSHLSQGRPLDRAPHTVQLAALGVAVCTGVCVLVLRYGSDWLLGMPILWRSVLTMVLLFPLGCCLGMLFPTGIRVAGVQLGSHVPKLWGANGLASVTGSVLAMVGAKFIGFSGVLGLGVVTYLCLLLLANGMGGESSDAGRRGNS